MSGERNILIVILVIMSNVRTPCTISQNKTLFNIIWRGSCCSFWPQRVSGHKSIDLKEKSTTLLFGELWIFSAVSSLTKLFCMIQRLNFSFRDINTLQLPLSLCEWLANVNFIQTYRVNTQFAAKSWKIIKSTQKSWFFQIWLTHQVDTAVRISFCMSDPLIQTNKYNLEYNTISQLVNLNYKLSYFQWKFGIFAKKFLQNSEPQKHCFYLLRLPSIYGGQNRDRIETADVMA